MLYNIKSVIAQPLTCRPANSEVLGSNLIRRLGLSRSQRSESGLHLDGEIKNINLGERGLVVEC